MNNKKIDFAFFDFCETIVDLQSADDFVLFVLLKRKMYLRYIFCLYLKYSLLNKVLNKLIPNFGTPKKRILKLLKGISESELEFFSRSYCDTILKNCMINSIIQKMRQYKDDGAKIIVVSGGYHIYIKYFLPDLIDLVIATNLDFDNGVFKGSIKGADCLGIEKVTRIKQHKCLYKIDKFNTSVYSDSLTDLPIFELSNNSFFVTKNLNFPVSKYNLNLFIR